MDNNNDDEWDIDSLCNAVSSLIKAMNAYATITAQSIHTLQTLGITIGERPGNGPTEH
jgi:hypothetical protein